jgi:hypothetical protein
MGSPRFAATAGPQNAGFFTTYQSLVPDRPARLLRHWRYRVSRQARRVRRVAGLTQYELDVGFAPPFLQLTSVPASNPFNPFGTTVRASGVVQGAENLAKLFFEEEFVRPLVGVRG